MGISNDVIEDCLAHKNGNKIKRSYELERATIEQKRTLTAKTAIYRQFYCRK